MKPILLLALLLAVRAGLAAPCQKEQVAADVKWLVHLDVESFLKSQLGAFAAREIIDPKMGKATGELKNQFGIELDWRKLRGLTAYGTEFKARGEVSGVLILHGDLGLATSLDSVIAKLTAQVGEASPLKKTQAEPFPIYAMKREVFGTPLPGQLFLLSRSKEDLERARAVILGKAANLAATKSFNIFPEAPKGFFLVGVAEGFAQAPLPPQAMVLKSADGGRVVAGERGDKFFLNVALSAKDAESAGQIQQVVQGLLALAALSQDKNKDLQQLAEGTKVSLVEKMVTVNVELPIAAVLTRVAEEQRKQPK